MTPVTGRRAGLRCVAILLCIYSYTLCAQLTSHAAVERTRFGWTKLPAVGDSFSGSETRMAVVANALIAVPASADARVLPILHDPKGKWETVAVGEDVDWQALYRACESTATHAHHDRRLFGFGSSSASSTVFSAELVEGKLNDQPLPELPTAIASSRGAVLDEFLYVLGVAEGGFQFFRIRLPASSEKSSWHRLSPPPISLDSQVILAPLDGALWLCIQPNPSLTDGRSAPAAWRWTHAAGWVASDETPPAGSFAHVITVGQSHALLADADFTDTFFYHSVTETWRPIDIDWPPFDADLSGTPGRPAAIHAWRGGMVVAAGNACYLGIPERTVQGWAGLNIGTLCAYLIVVFSMGFWFVRRERDGKDYFRAGQRIPWWAAGISLLGTSLSAITFMAFPAMAYRTDWIYLLGNFMILAVAPPVIWFYLPFFRRLEVTSAYEYLERRYGLATRLVGSATFLLFQTARMAIVIYLPALGLSAVSGWNVYMCIAVIGLLATFYTTLGGIEAVIWTDVLQVVVLLCGAVVSMFVMLSKMPDDTVTVAIAAATAGKLRAVDLSWSAASTSLWVVLIGSFFKFLIPYSSDQAVIQRYLTTRDERQAANSIWLNAVASIPVWTLFFALGTTLWAFYRTFPERLDATGRTDEIFAWFIVRELPPGISGLVVAALLAASMSSLDSSLNSMASALTTDFYARLRTVRCRARPPSPQVHDAPRSSQQQELAFARLATLVLGFLATLLATWLAWLEALSIWDLFLAIIGLFGGGLAGMFMAGIFTRRVHETGVLIGFFASAAVLSAARTSESVHFFLYGGIGILTCFSVSWLASVLIPQPGQNIEGLTLYTLAKRQ